MADPGTMMAIGLGISALTGIGTTAATLMNQPKPPAMPGTPPPSETPVGTPTSNRPEGGAQSFLAAAAGGQQQQQTGKTMLGQ